MFGTVVAGFVAIVVLGILGMTKVGKSLFS